MKKTAKEMEELLISLRNGGCGRERNQHFKGQDYRENCVCCDTVRENIDDFFSEKL